jgi:ABC-2 type transport system permease protein
MHAFSAVFSREFLGYFRTPVAYVFLVVFLVASTGLAFFMGGLFDGRVASLERFFLFHPFLYLFLVPAVGMRLWAEERRSGTVELLFTLPITPLRAVVGKFLAAWSFLGIALLSTFLLPLTVAYLGDPDWGVILASYLGSFLMAGAYLGICSLVSALTKNQVIAFVISVSVCLVLVLLGWSVFQSILEGIFPTAVVAALETFSFTTHFESMLRGLIDLRALVYFGSLMIFTLLLNVLVVER